MRKVGDLVGHERTADAAMVGPAFHAGLEKRAVDDQLPAALEQVEQACFAAGTIERVFLLSTRQSVRTNSAVPRRILTIPRQIIGIAFERRRAVKSPRANRLRLAVRSPPKSLRPCQVGSFLPCSKRSERVAAIAALFPGRAVSRSDAL